MKISPETAKWLAVLRKYKRTEHWLGVEKAAFKKTSNRCTRCSELADMVKHLTYLKIGREEASDVTVLCQRCRSPAAFAACCTPGYLAPSAKAEMEALLTATPPNKVNYLKSNRSRGTLCNPRLTGRSLDIARARSVYLYLLIKAVELKMKTLRIHRKNLVESLSMKPAMVTLALNVLQNHGWLYRFTKLEQSHTGELKGCIIVELRHMVQVVPSAD